MREKRTLLVTEFTMDRRQSQAKNYVTIIEGLGAYPAYVDFEEFSFFLLRFPSFSACHLQISC